MTTSVAPAIPTDPDLPDARALLEPEGSEVLALFLAERGWSLNEARPVQAMYRPGRSLLVRYRARAKGPGGPRILSLCAEVSSYRRRLVEPVEGFAERFGMFQPVSRIGPHLVWAYPYDPSLAELSHAAWGPSVRDRLDEPTTAVSVQLLRYRPRRRAVFRYRSLHPGREWRTSFGKVIPSRKSERSQAATEHLRAAGMPVKVPLRLGRQTLLTPEVEGRSLRDLLLGGSSLPSPRRIADVIARFERTAPGGLTWSRPSASSVAEHTAGLIGRLVPERRAEVDLIRDSVEAGDSAASPSHVVHGDLYEAQVLVGRKYALSLIDLDDVALGDARMDAANFCAHLLVLALSVPSAASRLLAYRRLARDAFRDGLGVSSSDLAWREALCVLQLGAGPFRVLDPRWPQEAGRRIEVAVRLLREGE